MSTLKRKTSKRSSQQYNDQSLALALQAIEKGMSEREASKTWNVPKSTLHYRIHGRQDRHEAHELEQRLTPAQEQEIVAWCDEMERRFLPVRLSQLKDYATVVLQDQAEPGEIVLLGGHWEDRFRDRHPELRTVIGRSIDERRAMAKNPRNIMDWYVQLSNLFEKFKIPVENRFNCDEKGYQQVSGGEHVIILRRDSDDQRGGRPGALKQTASRETITTIECICADGTVLPPFIIMRGKYVLKRWCKDSPLPESTRWACSPNGWTNNQLGVDYIQAFDEWTSEKGAGGKWRCLILDGHGSHVTYDFLMYAIQARIIVVGLPSHTTDFLQPLDVGLFGPLQRNYREEISSRIRNGQPVTKDSFASVLDVARKKTYTEQNIKKAFEATGITPLDAWRTDVMRAFRKRLQDKTRSSSHRDDPITQREKAKAKYLDLINDPNATAEQLREGLTAIFSALEGAEARNSLLNSELKAAKEAARVRRKRPGEGGRVGQGHVWIQSEIEAREAAQVKVKEAREAARREAEEARTKAKAERAARAGGRGRGRPRGRGRGRTQPPSPGVKEHVESEVDDPFLLSAPPSESESESD